METATETEPWKLEAAVRDGDLRRVQGLITAQPADFVQNHTNLLTWLTQVACSDGHLEILRYFVEEHNVDINATTTEDWHFLCESSGSSLLQISISEDQSHLRDPGNDGCPNTFACIEWLVYAGAKVHHKNSKGEDALATACKAKHLPALAVLAWYLIRDWSGVKQGKHPWYSFSKTGTAWYPVVGSSRDNLQILGRIWYALIEMYPTEDRNYLQLADFLGFISQHIHNNVFENELHRGYQWIGEPVCAFQPTVPEGDMMFLQAKIPRLHYLRYKRLMARWEDAYAARESSGITGTRTKSGLEVFSTLDEYFYPDLDIEASTERNNNQVLLKHQRNYYSGTEQSSDTVVLAVSQVCVWKINNSTFSSIMDFSKPREELCFSLGDHMIAAGAGEEIVGILLSKLLVDADVVLQDHRAFKIPRLATIFARSIARVQQDVNDYVQVLGASDITLERQFLQDIEDIREEVSMIQTVLIQQEGIWKEFAYRYWPHYWKGGYEGKFEPNWEDDWNAAGKDHGPDVKIHQFQEKWKVIRRPQEYFSSIRTQLNKLDHDGERVQRSIELKLDLNQRHESLTEARKASVMGALVLGFTIVTIVFTPLSFMTGLFALPIDRLQMNQVSTQDSQPGETGAYSTTYIGEWMVVGELVSLAVTIFAVWAASKYFSKLQSGRSLPTWPPHQPERNINREKSRRTESLGSGRRSGDTSRDRQEQIDGEAFRGTDTVEVKWNLRGWLGSKLRNLADWVQGGKETGSPV